MNKNTTLFSALLTTLLLSACSDGTVSSGGGAGDTEGDSLAVALIVPLVGLYDLPDNWRGGDPSDAYLEIQEPGANGISNTFLYLANTMRNCIEPRLSSGQVTKDPVSDLIFFDSFNIGNSILSKLGDDLNITLAEDVNDVDDDGDFDEPNSLRAVRVNVMVSDLGETCQ